MTRRPQFRIVSRWLTLRQLAVKYNMDSKTAKKWMRGQGKGCYRLRVIRTPVGLRILDPELEFPPHRTAPARKMFIFNAHEVGSLIGVSYKTILRMVDRGRLHCKLYGGRRYFSLTEVRQLLRERGALPRLLEGD